MWKGHRRAEGREYRKFITDIQLNLQQEFSSSVRYKPCYPLIRTTEYGLMTEEF
jgi:hypothetical protein